MFCSECGVKAGGKFCWSCGQPLRQTATENLPTVPVNWSQLTDYASLIRVPDVRGRIAIHAARAKKRMSGEEFLEVCDKLMSPITAGVPLTAIAALAQPLGEKLGLKSGTARSARFAEPTGIMIVAVLCSLAQNGQQLQNVAQQTSGCTIDATLPSDMWSLAGELHVAIREAETATEIDATAKIKGQLYDWGKGRRALNQLFNDITTLAKAA